MVASLRIAALKSAWPVKGLPRVAETTAGDRSAAADLCTHVNLLDSLLDAIIRLNGDALVMHVGEKPYVVTTAEASNEFRGPLAWGQVELSSRVLTLEAVSGMLGQILPLDQSAALNEFGATEFEVSAAANQAERFTIVAARGGDDIWLEIRRHSRPSSASVVASAEPASAPAEAAAPVAERAAPAADAQPAAVPVEAAEVVAPAPIVHGEPIAETPQPTEVIAPSLQATIVQPEAEPVEPARNEAIEIEDDETHEAFTASVPLEEEVLGFDQDAAATEPHLVTADGWGDDIMTEGDLGELLRASASAIITGETSGESFDFAPDLDSRPAVPEVPLLDLAGDEPLVMAEETVERTLAAEQHAGEQAPAEVPVVAVADAPEQDPGIAAREALLAEQEALFAAHAVPAAGPQPAAGIAEDVISPPAEAVPPAGLAEAVAARPEAEEQPIALDVVTLPIDETQEGQVRDDMRPAASVEAPEVERGDLTPEPLEEEIEKAPPARPAAVVLPLTRTPRVEVPSDSRAGTGALERILRLSAARGAATVYLVAQSAPLIRVDGEFSPLEGEPAVDPALIERLTGEFAPRGRDASASPASEWLVDVPEIGRVRCTAFRDHRGPGLIFRMVPQRAISADQLGLPAEVQALCSEAEGLVLVAGARGSGKSTLLTSFVDLINRTRSDHVITIESQIEFLHENKRSFISQREVRGDNEAMAAAVRSACREEPDVLIVEDLRTPELFSLALEAADSGRLVFGSVPAPSAVLAIERIIEMFPPERREKVQASLAGALRGVVSQVLLRKLRGGRVAAREVLLNTPPVASLIMEGKTFQLPAALENGRRVGMMPFAESLAALVREGIVHPAHAYRKAPSREQFLTILRRDGVDVSVAERLA